MFVVFSKKLSVKFAFVIKSRHRHSIVIYWLGRVCSSRAELFEFGQKIEFFKDKLGLLGIM